MDVYSSRVDAEVDDTSVVDTPPPMLVVSATVVYTGPVVDTPPPPDAVHKNTTQDL